MSVAGESRFLYLIFSHDNQKQLVRLAAAIRHLSPSAAIAIHHDPAKGQLVQDLFAGINDVRLVTDPVPGQWGCFSLVEQYLHALRWCQENIRFAWVCTITGLSYPVMPLIEFEDRIRRSAYDAFMRHFDAFDPGPYPKGVWPEGTGETRYLFRYYEVPRFRHAYLLPTALRRWGAGLRQRINCNSSLIRLIPMPRGAPTRFGIRRTRIPMPPGFVLCGGRQMLNLNKRALDRVLRFVNSNPAYTQFFRRCLIPDEGFFTSIVANDPELRVCNDVLRYIRWPKAIGATSVGVLGADEVDAALGSGLPFALKLDQRVDPAALDLIDARLGLAAATAVRWPSSPEAKTSQSHSRTTKP